MLPLQLAWRFLTEGRTQSLLIVAGVTVGVAAYVFITATITGVQANLLEKTLGTQAHVIVTNDTPPLEPVVHAEGRRVLRRVVPPEPRQTPFDEWQRTASRVEATPGIVAVSPTLRGAGLALRGGGQTGIEIVGADPSRLRRIVDLPGHLVEGTYRPTADRVLVGTTLASDLGLRVGSPLRIRTDSTEANVRVVGIFELGNEGLDGRWVVTSLRGAQNLLGRPGDVSTLDAIVDDVFQADTIARDVAARTGRPTESWIDRNASLLTALSAQSQSTILIRVFTLLAVAMGIASVLAVTVVQRRAQIGILRAMGVRRRVVLLVFLWQGALFGVAGAFLGTGLGALAGFALDRVVPFSIAIDPLTAGQALGISVATGIAAALWPARTAARMDPAAAIRGDG